MLQRSNERKVNKERRRASTRRIINQDIIKIAIFFACLFFAMALFLGKYVIVDSSSVINNTYNKRSESLKKSVLRGNILSRDGTVLAYSELSDDGSVKRVYPYGEVFAHAVGFEDCGGLGLESSYNYYLLTSHVSFFDKVANEFKGTMTQGDSCVTTLDVGIQQKLYEILDGNEGAIIVMNPENGEILGMVSNPGFDPNCISEIWDEINTDSDNGPLLNRATQATLTPGSTFKLFTLLEYYRENSGDVSDTVFDCGGSVTLDDGTVISCPDGKQHGSQSLKSAFANSCNVAFSEIGIGLSLDEFAANNEKMLFNTDFNLDFPTRASTFSLDEQDSPFMIMETAFGQGETLVSPLHLAMVTCAIANKGVLMKPHLVSEIDDAYGNTVKKYENEEYAVLLTEDEAAFMKEYMRAVVTEGTGIILSYDGNYISYGKTGTAETSSNEEENYDHSWFTGFAENDGTTLVVCAMIENTQEAGITGVYAVKQVFDYYFN